MFEGTNFEFYFFSFFLRVKGVGRVGGRGYKRGNVGPRIVNSYV